MWSLIYSFFVNINMGTKTPYCRNATFVSVSKVLTFSQVRTPGQLVVNTKKSLEFLDFQAAFKV
jgi:hypothetical protein